MKKEIIIICDNIRSAYNIGTIFRSADALGIEKIYLLGITPTPQNPKVQKTALGAEKTIPWEKVKQPMRLLKKLKKQNYQIISLETGARAKNYTQFSPRFPLAVILDNEVMGIKKNILKASDEIIFLPQLGEKESLNVAVAFGVIGYHLRHIA